MPIRAAVTQGWAAYVRSGRNMAGAALFLFLRKMPLHGLGENMS
jgi:hypothetical protein